MMEPPEASDQPATFLVRGDCFPLCSPPSPQLCPRRVSGPCPHRGRGKAAKAPGGSSVQRSEGVVSAGGEPWSKILGEGVCGGESAVLRSKHTNRPEAKPRTAATLQADAPPCPPVLGDARETADAVVMATEQLGRRAKGRSIRPHVRSPGTMEATRVQSTRASTPGPPS